MLRIQGIDTYYGETQVLFDVSLDVAAGEIVALLGPNGAGKTTTLRSILGLTPARRGKIALSDADITQMRTFEIARKGVGWVPDDRRIVPSLTAVRNCRANVKTSPAVSCRWCRYREHWSAVRGWCCSTNPHKVLLPRSCRT